MENYGSYLKELDKNDGAEKPGMLEKEDVNEILDFLTKRKKMLEDTNAELEKKQ